MKSYRRVEGDPKGPKHWRRLRKGVADLRRRAEVSQKCNERYVEALAAVDSPASLQETLRPISQAKTWRRRRVRAMQPFQLQDGRLFEAIGRGEFALNGFRNRDLRPLLYPKSNLSADEQRRHSSKISRQLRLFASRNHQKNPKDAPLPTQQKRITDCGCRQRGTNSQRSTPYSSGRINLHTRQRNKTLAMQISPI